MLTRLTKEERVLDSADAALTLWRSCKKGNPSILEETDIVDLITDLLHLAEENTPWSGYFVSTRAYEHFAAERDGDDDLPFNYGARK